jgi:hypothetical protein
VVANTLTFALPVEIATLMLNDFIKAREEKKICFKKNLLPNTPKWNDFFNLMTKKFNTPFDMKESYVPEERMITSRLEDGSPGATNIMLYNKMDPVIFQAVQYKDGNFGHNDIDATELIEFIKPLFPSFELKAIMNMIGGESEYWVHKDDHDVISWHCEGTMEWRIYPNLRDENIDQIKVKDEPYDSYILEPGDVIYVPAWTGHQVVTPSPRASIILQTSQQL